MVSQMCIEDIEMMKEEGLNPTPKDIIRLNELALNFERVKSMKSTNSIYSLPRVAHIDSERWFRQPSLGHDIWLQSLSRFISMDSIETSLAVNAYALSRDYTELPDAENIKEVVKSINEFLETMKDFNKEQLLAAIEYVQTGIEPSWGEYPEFAKKRNKDEDEDEREDWNECVAVGILNNGVAVLHGVTLSEMKSMTQNQVEALIEKTMMYNRTIDNDSRYELANYNRTLDKIRERLINEKNEVKV